MNRHASSRTGSFSLEHDPSQCESTVVELNTQDGRKVVSSDWVTARVPPAPTALGFARVTFGSYAPGLYTLIALPGGVVLACLFVRDPGADSIQQGR